MEVQRRLYVSSSELCKEIVRIREEFLLPCETCPSDSLIEFIATGTAITTLVSRCSACYLGPCVMPVHVDDHHVHRNVVVPEMVGKVDEFIV